MSYIADISTANPDHKHSQRDIAEFYCGTLNGNDPDGSIARSIRVLAAKSAIQHRYSVVGDFSEDAANRAFFPGGHKDFVPGLEDRMKLFSKKALPLALQAVHGLKSVNALSDTVSHIITVTCTGLSAPGLELQLISALGLKPWIQRSAVNFMGCNAGILALRQADQICRSSANAVVLIVCVELCSIHFQHAYSEDYLLSNLLFGDGAAAVVVTSCRNREEGPLAVVGSFQSLLVNDSNSEMGWNLSEKGFIMSLSPAISALLNKALPRHFTDNGINPRDIANWAIHPGGKRILDDLCATLDMDSVALSSSYHVLKQYGNMSSATIFYVLKDLQRAGAKGTTFAAGFGPGLTIESAILEYV